MMKSKVNSIQIIILAIAILGAVTGTISFSLQMWEKWHYRSRVIAELIGVYDIDPGESELGIVVVVEFRNMGKNKVMVLETPDLIVKDLSGNEIGIFNLDPTRWDEPIYVSLEAFEVKSVAYFGRELAEAITSGVVPDIRSKAENIIFQLTGKSSVGRFSSQIRGMRRLDESTVEWLKKAGGIEK